MPDRHPHLPSRQACLFALTLFIASPLYADAGAHADPVAPVALWLAIILIGAKLAGDLAVRAAQPAVLGELMFGVVLGNLSLLGIDVVEAIKHDPFVDMFARVGVLVLLFEVGLESTVAQMVKVGVSSLLVAMLGVVAPFALGWATSAWLLPGQPGYVHAFLGATLCATSIGITARVLKDLGYSQTNEARIILGAAVIDDVLGLIILAVVSGAIAAIDSGGESVGPSLVLWITLKATGVLLAAILLGLKIAPHLFAAAAKLRAPGVLLALGLSLCFLLSWLVGLIGLAPIVGAFAAGLILEEVHYRDFVSRGEHGLEELIHPIAAFLVPVFFVLMGMHTDLHSFTQQGVLALAVALTLAAILGKQGCALGVIGKDLNRLAIAIGMMPRGEVGLIFASIGQGLSVHGQSVLDQTTFSAIVVMVIATTMLTPPALKWSLRHTK